MAEPQGGAQNKLGELFVEFGTKGLPSLLKNLNSVSASFLLAKNGASQLTQTLTKPFKEAGRGAIEFGKMSTALGLTLQEYMKLQIYLKSHNLSDSLISDMSSTADMLTKVSMGIGGIGTEFAYAMNQMGLSWTDYDGSFESILQLAKDVQKATKDMEPARRRIMLQNTGFSSPDWQYAFERGDFNLDDYKTVSDEQVNELIKSQDSMAQLSAEFEQLKMHLVSKLSPALEKIADWLTEKVKDATDDTVPDILEKNAGIIGGGVAVTNPGAGMAIIGAGNLAKMQRGLGGTTGHLVPMGFGAAQLDFGTAPWVDNKSSNINSIAPPLPSNMSNTSTVININNENRVQVSNPQEVGPAISSINQETIQDIEYSQYQLSNLPGL